MLKVVDNWPIPPINRSPKGGRRKYPLDTMQVGQMFFVEGRTGKAVSAYISRISKAMEAKFEARSCWAVVDRHGNPREAAPNAPGAKQGAGVWRTE